MRIFLLQMQVKGKAGKTDIFYWTSEENAEAFRPQSLNINL